MTTARNLRLRLRQRGLDGVTLLLLPCVLFVVALFVYPFLYGLVLSFRPKQGGPLANYIAFFSDHFLYDTISTTLVIAVPVTLLNVVLSIPVAMRVRLMRRQKLLTTILVIPITLGTGTGRRGTAYLSWSTRLGKPSATGFRPDRQSNPAGA